MKKKIITFTLILIVLVGVFGVGVYTSEKGWLNSASNEVINHSERQTPNRLEKQTPNKIDELEELREENRVLKEINKVSSDEISDLLTLHRKEVEVIRYLESELEKANNKVDKNNESLQEAESCLQ